MLNLPKSDARRSSDRSVFRWILLPGCLLVVSSERVLLAAQEPAQTKQIRSSSATQPASPRLKKVPVPKRDPADQPFRLAAMAESTRSIAIPLATNLHLAFDTQLLRTHTVWAGPSLSLFGTPFLGSKTPFLSTHDGPTLWSTPPISAWSVLAPSTNLERSLPTGSDFKGISTAGGIVKLMYDVAFGDGKKIRVRESPSAMPGNDGALGVVRRLEIAPASSDLWFLAHAEMDVKAPQALAGQSLTLQRSNDTLVVHALGSQELTWQITEAEVSHTEELNAERAGESVVERRSVSGKQTRAYLRIPAHGQPVIVEISSAVCGTLEQARRVIAELEAASAERARDGFPVRSLPHLQARQPKVTGGDKLAVRLAGGDDHYRIEHFPLPREIGLMVTGMDWVSQDELAVSTWSGEIYIVEKATGAVEAARYRRFASGLNEPLGLKVIEGQIYVTQKPELTRIVDTDGNGEADLFETINNDWGYSGNYHAFAFGPVLDPENNFYAFLCGQRGRWDVPYVGWCVKISADGGKLEGFCSGLRAPNGFGTYGPGNDLFIADNQGNWVGT
ncbi:MAG: hypothetical protein HY735_11745, partial [Verrucomicrobia bacterium]|nr:hypothetical protein [Verrucomicrobiota bacterium]